MRAPVAPDGARRSAGCPPPRPVAAVTLLAVDQNWKDSLEDAGSALAQVAAGFVPGVGPFLAAAVPLVAGSAQMRRVERDLLALRADVEDAVRSGRISNVEAALTSETFLAGVQFTVQRMLETASEERRQRLRNALVAGAAGEVHDPEATLRLTDRLEEHHVRVLRELRRLGVTTQGQFLSIDAGRLRNALTQTHGKAMSESQVRNTCSELAGFGMVQAFQHLELDDATITRPTRDSAGELGVGWSRRPGRRPQFNRGVEVIAGRHRPPWRGERTVECRRGDEFEVVGGEQQMPADSLRLSRAARDSEDHHAYALRLRLFDRLGEVVVPAEEVHRVDGGVAGVPDEIEPDAQVDALLLPVDADPSEAEFHTRQDGYLFLLRSRLPISCGVVPIDTQQVETAALLNERDQLADKPSVVDVHSASQR